MEFLKILYVFNFGYALSTTSYKLAVIAFYWRAFPVKVMRRLLLIATGVVLAYFLTSMFADAFRWFVSDPQQVSQRLRIASIPIHKFWDFELKRGHCMNSHMANVGTGIINTVLDFTLLLLV